MSAAKPSRAKGATKKRRRATSRTSRAQLLALHAEVFAKARRVLLQKNADYGRDADALANFRLGAMAAGITVAQAIVSRDADKLFRLGLAAQGVRLRVREDDVVDAVNFPVLIKAALRERRGR